MTDLPHVRTVTIEHFVVSPLHRYEGRPADGPVPVDEGLDETPAWIDLRAGLGIRGDRFFGKAAHRTAAVTLFSAETLDELQTILGTGPLDPVATRRNIILRGADIDLLAGQPFSLDAGDGPVEFEGHRPANPCRWMNTVIAPGAHKAMRGRGGIRSTPTTNGSLKLGLATLRTGIPVPPRAAAAAQHLF